MKLELKHLAGYLPYGLIIKDIAYPCEFILSGSNIGMVEGEYYKPILRPLSDLTKEIEIYGEENWKNIPMDIIDGKSCSLVGGKEFKIMLKNGTYNIYELRYATYNFLLENHFDVFGLIEQNLAINKNEL